MSTLEVDGRTIELTRPDKLLWPSIGFSKRSLVEYYAAVAPVLLPHIANRALTLVRLPDGIEGPGFYQQDCRGAPDWLPLAPIPARNGKVFRYAIVNDRAALLWVANLATIELHPFLTTVDDPERAPVLVFDLDPGPAAGLPAACAVALAVRAALSGRGLLPVVKTSGGAGLHLHAALPAPTAFAQTRAHARAIARALAAAHPDRVTDVVGRAGDRADKVLIDWRQNHERRSLAAAYSLRVNREPLASTPVTWAEIEEAAATGDARPLVFRPADVIRRIERHGDLFAGALSPPPPSDTTSAEAKLIP